MDLVGKYLVWYTRYGALLYYPASTPDEAERFIRLHDQLGEINVQHIEKPDGTRVLLEG